LEDIAMDGSLRDLAFSAAVVACLCLAVSFGPPLLFDAEVGTTAPRLTTTSTAEVDQSIADSALGWDTVAAAD
jgi:hypothetical protein